MIGSLGDVVFDVSSEHVHTFRDMKIQHSAKYSEHAIHGGKALLEFTGYAPDSLSFSVRLDAALGVNPKQELEALRDILTGHEAVPFILDGEPQGEGLWVLEGLDESYDVVDSHGTLIAADVSLKLKEYIEAGENGS